MLRLRPQQLLPFMQASIDWTIDYVQGAEAALVDGCSREEIEKRVRSGYTASVGFGIEDELLALRIVVLVLELGPAFARDPEVRALMSGPGSAQARVNALLVHPSLDRLRQSPITTRWTEPRSS